MIQSGLRAKRFLSRVASDRSQIARRAKEKEKVSRRHLTSNTDVHINPVVVQRQAMTLWNPLNGESHVHSIERRRIMPNLTNKAALVTGGSRGIGAAIAKRLAADGANVAITYTKGADAASSVVQAIKRGGGKAIAIQADAADAEAVKAAVEKTVATFGRLDVLVNNAGTAIPKTFEESTLEEMDRVIDINVRGVLVATQAALKHMKSGGRIIMIGSAVGERVAAPGLVPYAATKGAVKMFTQALAREIGSRGITVNNVQPGPIDTELNPAAGDWAVPQKAATALDRYGHVDEIAAMVAFVAGPESSYVTGANLTVDGGMNA
jgi:3-oxoacyl-[acyl-carrier protein] reductase